MPNDWRKLNGCACTYCQNVWKDEASLTEGGENPVGCASSASQTAPSASESFDRVLDRLKILATKKGKDYGTEDDTIANLRAAEDFGMPSWVGCLLRANDKIRRLQTFVKTNRLHCEPADDALEDLAVYAIWAIVLRNEEAYPPGKITSFDTV